MPSYQTIIMAQFLQLVKLFNDNIGRIKEIKEINRVKRKKRRNKETVLINGTVSNFMTNSTRKNMNYMLATRKQALSLSSHAYLVPVSEIGCYVL